VSSHFTTKRTAGSFFLSSMLAGSWYTTTTAVLSGPTADSVPVVGAIALAGLVPLVAPMIWANTKTENANLNMAQKLQAFDSHAIVNIVDTKGLLEEVNDRFLALTGYSREQLIGQPVAMLYDDRFKALASEISSSLKRGETWQGETPLRCANGQMICTQVTVMPLYDEKGKWTGSITARTDVTRANQLLAERDTAETLDELRDDIWIVDAQTHNLSYMNRSAMRRVGWTDSAYTDRTLEDLAQETDCENILNACEALKSSDESMTQFVTELKGKDFQATIKMLQIGRAPGRFLIMLHDITDQVNEERTKSEFISMVSHELRSPLTSIKGSMGLLLSRAAGELPTKARALLEISHRNADRLVLIINDILDLEKIANGRLEFDLQETDIADLLRETSDANATLEQRFDVNIQVENTSKPVMLTTDPNRVIQVLTNLLSNAAKFSKPGDRILVSLEHTDEEIRVSVSDKGQGIPAGEQHKVFQRFADLSNSNRAAKGGTGLGLSVCKAIVENLGGKIGFDSREGFGTTFYFTLPKKHSQMGAKETAPLMREAS